MCTCPTAHAFNREDVIVLLKHAAYSTSQVFRALKSCVRLICTQVRKNKVECRRTHRAPHSSKTHRCRHTQVHVIEYRLQRVASAATLLAFLFLTSLSFSRSQTIESNRSSRRSSRKFTNGNRPLLRWYAKFEILRPRMKLLIKPQMLLIKPVTVLSKVV